MQSRCSSRASRSSIERPGAGSTSSLNAGGPRSFRGSLLRWLVLSVRLRSASRCVSASSRTCRTS
eukprot:4202107-Prymnesium_polylepis.1